MRVIAHRGEHANAPENSMQAFQNAADMALFGIELDVHLTADHVPIVFHHMQFRSQERSGFIADYTYADLKHMVLTCPTTQQSYFMPSLQDVLTSFANKLYLEMHVQSVSPETITEVAAVLSGYRDAWHHMELTSYEPAILLGFKDACPDIATDLLFKPESWMTPETALRLIVEKGRLAKARGVHLFSEQITPEAIAFIRPYGLDIHCGVVDDVATFQRMQALGILQLLSNDVPLLLKPL
jgi:glycerophosphoryl diester phosphodiesterase